jgi:hypothetical protein
MPDLIWQTRRPRVTARTRVVQWWSTLALICCVALVGAPTAAAHNQTAKTLNGFGIVWGPEGGPHYHVAACDLAADGYNVITQYVTRRGEGSVVGGPARACYQIRVGSPILRFRACRVYPQHFGQCSAWKRA